MANENKPSTSKSRSTPRSKTRSKSRPTQPKTTPTDPILAQADALLQVLFGNGAPQPARWALQQALLHARSLGFSEGLVAGHGLVRPKA